MEMLVSAQNCLEEVCAINLKVSDGVLNNLKIFYSQYRYGIYMEDKC